MTIEAQPWGVVDGEAVSLYTLTNANGLVARITNYGGIVVALLVPDRTGTFGDVVLGLDTLEAYAARCSRSRVRRSISLGQSPSGRT
jgi:aldose 1-epimerase